MVSNKRRLDMLYHISENIRQSASILQRILQDGHLAQFVRLHELSGTIDQLDQMIHEDTTNPHMQNLHPSNGNLSSHRQRFPSDHTPPAAIRRRSTSVPSIPNAPPRRRSRHQRIVIDRTAQPRRIYFEDGDDDGDDVRSFATTTTTTSSDTDDHDTNTTSNGTAHRQQPITHLNSQESSSSSSLVQEVSSIGIDDTFILSSASP